MLALFSWTKFWNNPNYGNKISQITDPKAWGGGQSIRSSWMKEKKSWLPLMPLAHMKHLSLVWWLLFNPLLLFLCHPRIFPTLTIWSVWKMTRAGVGESSGLLLSTTSSRWSFANFLLCRKTFCEGLKREFGIFWQPRGAHIFNNDKSMNLLSFWKRKRGGGHLSLYIAYI